MKKSNDHSDLKSTLAYLALGLGTVELFACRRVARLIGLRPTSGPLRVLRLLGIRELATGFGLLRSRPAPWLAARVFGDVLDIGLLVRSLRLRKGPGLFGRRDKTGRIGAVLASVAGISTLDIVALARSAFGQRHPVPEGAPALRASITVERTPSDVYSFWRDFDNFPRFMSQVESVTSPDQIRSRWKAKSASSTPVEWNATVVEDTPDRRLVWRLQSTSMKLLVDTVEVLFELAPGGRGTEVHVSVFGTTGVRPAVALRWLRKMPEGLVFEQLRRFKQVIELGEVIQSDSSIHTGSYPARPSPKPINGVAHEEPSASTSANPPSGVPS